MVQHGLTAWILMTTSSSVLTRAQCRSVITPLATWHRCPLTLWWLVQRAAGRSSAFSRTSRSVMISDVALHCKILHYVDFFFFFVSHLWNILLVWVICSSITSIIFALHIIYLVLIVMLKICFHSSLILDNSRLLSRKVSVLNHANVVQLI